MNQRLVTSSALEPRKWQLTGVSQRCRSALCEKTMSSTVSSDGDRQRARAFYQMDQGRTTGHEPCCFGTKCILPLHDTFTLLQKLSHRYGMCFVTTYNLTCQHHVYLQTAVARSSSSKTAPTDKWTVLHATDNVLVTSRV